MDHAGEGEPDSRRARSSALWTWSRRHDREISWLAFPALGSLAAPPLVGLVDVFLSGRLGTTEQSALAIGVAMFGLLVFSTNFLEYGTTALVARYSGAGQHEAAWLVGKRALIMAIAIGAVLSVLTWVFAGWFATNVMQARGDVADNAALYLVIRMLGAVPFMVMRAGHGWFRGRGDTLTPLVIAVAVAAISIVAAFPMGLGIGPWDGWGLAGLAIATAGAEALGAVVFVALMVARYPKKSRWLEASSRGAAAEPGAGWTALLTLNRDIFIRTLSVTGTFTLASAVAARADASGVVAAGHGIVASTWILSALMLDCFAIAAQSMTGRLLGAERWDEARQLAGRINAVEVVAGVIGGALLLVATPVIALTFTSDPDVRAQLTPALIVLALTLPLNAVVFGMDGVLIGAGDGPFLRNSMLVAALPTGAVLVAIGILGGPLIAIWGAIAMFLALRLFLMGARIQGDGWMRAYRDQAVKSGVGLRMRRKPR